MGKDEAKEPTYIDVEVEGVKLKIEQSKLGSYKYMKLMCANAEANTFAENAEEDERAKANRGIVSTSIDLVEFILGDQMEKVYANLGENATYNEVIDFYRKTMSAISEKRSLKN